ncbi:MAG: aminotransferase class V-fold PLP-dependent enzyme [Rhizobiales bacterium]|nr:aminotransferase class V-fold PLP-dependent enzyme [Hyphomicrobiales bacterium]MBI3672024.1 aminotransferase class V-fold PLP-dependent enzyme [Hyphomicrobiales bacterium]
MPGIKGLFIPGPTNVPQAVRLAMDIAMEDQRAPDLPSFTLPLFEDVKKVFKTREAQVFLFPASGTGGWEAAMTNTLSPGDKVLIARFGQFSLLWAEMCLRHGLDADVVDVPWGEGVPVDIFAEKLKSDRAHAYKAVLVTHNETATGVTSDVAAVRQAMDEAGHPALLFVDAVSSLASIDFRMDEWGVDICVSGSQKGFMMPAGLAILAVSPKALALRKSAQMKRCYFDFDDMIKTNRDGYFPYTPPIHMLRALRAAVDLLLAEGLDNVFARHHRLAEGVRRAVTAWGLSLCARAPKWHSNTVSAIVIPEGYDSGALVKHAYNRYGLSLGVGLNKLAGRAFRIGHLGDLNELMCLMALAGSEMAMRDLGIPVAAGSGVAAASEYYRETGAAAALKKAA